MVRPQRWDEVFSGGTVHKLAAGPSMNVTGTEEKSRIFKSGDEFGGRRNLGNELAELQG